ncbi:MAG: quinone-dependent dihydroorotate dehydrogenase [Saprospiraceae bacterium]|nr:quinone-dependent dihydroorotate dehydrogenase [Saprospiraceae bacterium]
MYKLLLKPIFFLFSPEQAHYLALSLFKIALATPALGYFLKQFYTVTDKKLEKQVWGLNFKNPVGLAAGFDKDGKYYQTMAALGFGFIEVGTVTPRPQTGNPSPRLFRLKKDEALINRMGFNNEGVEALIKNLQKKRPPGLIVGGNIGKNKDTPNEKAVDDYLYCFEKIFPYVDYFVVNVSSPNTPGLRELQDKEPLTQLLNALQKANQQKMAPKPILLKIAPDLSEAQLDDIIEIVKTTGIAGLIATNTTIIREGLLENTEKIGAGGLSGKPLCKRATEVIRYLYEKSGGMLTIIGVGGIAGPKDAIEKLEAGASLVQIYTGLIYEGPSLVKHINKSFIQGSPNKLVFQKSFQR